MKQPSLRTEHAAAAREEVGLQKSLSFVETR